MRSMPSMPPLQYVLKMRMPFGVLGVRESAGRVVAIDYLPVSTEPLSPQTALAAQAADEFAAYLRDAKREFALPFTLIASEFERGVWTAIRGIPPGQIRTYGDIARQVRSIPRAVGGACGRNPLPLLVPCHRVVAAGGIGGFMGVPSRCALRYSPLGRPGGLMGVPSRCALRYSPLGRPGGLMGGREDDPLAIKRWLLRHEGVLQ